jgi:hypothetical protein
MAQTFYRQGADIYNASSNQKIGATDWQKNWTGRATEVKAPTPSTGVHALNPNYDPNNPLIDRYIPTTVANSTPAMIGGGAPASNGGVTVIDPFKNDNTKVSVIEPNNTPAKVTIVDQGGQPLPNQEPKPISTGISQTQPRVDGPAPVGKSFYRIGQTIYDASSNKPISATDWSQNWTGRATEVQKAYEAIPHPSKISEYTSYIKQGNTLYGIKKSGNGTGTAYLDITGGVKIDPQDQNIKDILMYAGQSDMSPADVMSLLNLYSNATPDEQAKIETDLGIPDVVNSLYTKPSKTSEEIYQQAYDSSELPSMKTKIAEIDAQIKAKNDEITKATSDLQNNPWLSQASRGGRIRNMLNTADSELSNLQSARAQYLDQYNNGVGEIEKVMLRYKDQLESDQTLNASKLNYLLNQAEKKTTSLVQSKQTSNLRYLPDYLKSKADTVTSKTNFDLTKQQLELEKLGLDIAKAKKDSGELPTAVAGRVDKIANQFDGEATVKNYAMLVEGWNMVSQISDTTKNPADNQALIYAFAKAMDPTSVVREGEYATIQKYSQTWAENFGFNANRIVNNSEFLTSDAVKNIKATIAKKFAGTEASYNNLVSEYGRRINRITGSSDGTDYISNYSGGLMDGGADKTTVINEGKKQGYSQADIEATIKQYGIDTAMQLLGIDKKKTSSVGSGGMRTDRHNNPTAFTTDIAKQAGLKEGVDYKVGDPFPNNPNLKTATLLGDPIEKTIKVIDKIGFQTASGAPRWTYINMPKSQWDSMSYTQKKNTIAKMYKNEGGSALKQYFA